MISVAVSLNNDAAVVLPDPDDPVIATISGRDPIWARDRVESLAQSQCGLTHRKMQHNDGNQV